LCVLLCLFFLQFSALFFRQFSQVRARKAKGRNPFRVITQEVSEPAVLSPAVRGKMDPRLTLRGAGVKSRDAMGVTTRRGGVGATTRAGSGGGVKGGAAARIPGTEVKAGGSGKRVREERAGGPGVVGKCMALRPWRVAGAEERGGGGGRVKRKAVAEKTTPGRGSEQGKSKARRRAGQGSATPDGAPVQTLPVRARDRAFHSVPRVGFCPFFPRSRQLGSPMFFFFFGDTAHAQASLLLDGTCTDDDDLRALLSFNRMTYWRWSSGTSRARRRPGNTSTECSRELQPQTLPPPKNEILTQERHTVCFGKWDKTTRLTPSTSSLLSLLSRNRCKRFRDAGMSKRALSNAGEKGACPKPTKKTPSRQLHKTRHQSSLRLLS
jgi:hypothetical protein